MKYRIYTGDEIVTIDITTCAECPFYGIECDDAMLWCGCEYSLLNDNE